jgi:hypothetical protein
MAKSSSLLQAVSVCFYRRRIHPDRNIECLLQRKSCHINYLEREVYE